MARVPSLLRSQSNKLVRRDHGPPWGGRHTLRSPGLGFLQTFIELAMLFLPVRGARLDRSARLEPLESQGFQFFYPLLIGLNKPLQVGFDAEPLSLRSRTDLGFEVGMYRNTHSGTN